MIKWLLLLVFPLLCYGQVGDNAFAKGESHFVAKEYSKAKPILKSYLERYPNDQKALEYLGDIAGYTKDWDTGIIYYKKLVHLDQSNANYHYKYGGVLGMKALEINKFSALILLGDIKEAFLTSAALDPKHIEVRWALVELYIQLPVIAGGSEAKAIKYANELATLSPIDGYLAHGYIAEYNDRPLDAERYYKDAVRVGGSVTCYTKLFKYYEKNDAPEKAIKTLTEAQQKHKDNNRLHYQLGKIAGQYGIGLDHGIQCLGNYIENYTEADGVPKDWAYLRLAQIFRHKGNKAKAIEWITRALTGRSDFKEALAEKKLILLL